MRRVAQRDRADRGPGLTVHTGDRRDGRRVRVAVVGHGVGRDRTRRVGLVDGVGDRRAGDVVVVGGAGEAPRIAGVRPGIGVRRALTLTAPTVAPVSPFTPVIDVTSPCARWPS